MTEHFPQLARLVPPSAPYHWSRAMMARFLNELAATHSVSAAARAVGMTRQSAYRLRQRLKGQAFDLAWEAAVASAYDALHQAALDRALNGVEAPVHHKGELVGTRRTFDERLTMFLLSDRNRYAARQRQQHGRGHGHGGAPVSFRDLVACVRGGAEPPSAEEQWRAEIDALDDADGER